MYVYISFVLYLVIYLVMPCGIALCRSLFFR